MAYAPTLAPRRLRAAFALVLGPVAIASAQQDELYRLSGVTRDSNFGFKVAAMGDVDLDGFGDFAVGAPYHDASAIRNSGVVLVHSGATLARLFFVGGDQRELELGRAIAGGSSELVTALAKKIEGKAPIHMGMQLVKIADDGAALTLTFKSGNTTKSQKYSRVISAIPFTMLREVEGIYKLPLSPLKLRCIMTVGYGTNVKVMYGFTDRPWRQPAGSRPMGNGSMYTSLPSQCFWESSRAQAGKSGILTNFRGGAQGLRTVDADLFKETLGHLDQIVPGSAAKDDGKRATFLWPTYPFTKGAYSCPLVGQLTTVWEAKAEPELGGRFLFAGEHTSDDFGGFMNGAIESGNRCAREILAPK